MQSILQDIRTKFGEDRDEAFNLINQHLKDHPDDIDARLLKVELCLQNKSEPEFVGTALVTTTGTTPEQAALIENFRHQANDRAWELIGNGRGRMRSRFGGDAVSDFDGALQIAPKDQVVALAAALSLLRQLSNNAPAPSINPFGARDNNTTNTSTQNTDDEDDIDSWLSSLSIGKARTFPAPSPAWTTAIERYLRQAIALATPGERIHEVASICLLRHWLNTQKLSVEMLTLLESLGEPNRKWVRLHEETLQRALNFIHDAAMGLLRGEHSAKAARIFAACAETDLKEPRLLLLDAQRHAPDSPARLTALRKVARLANQAATPTLPSTTSLKTLLTLTQNIQVTCRICGREIRPNDETCRYCESRQTVNILLAESFGLTNEVDVPALAMLGIAAILRHNGDRAEALALAENARTRLPTDKQNTAPLLALINGLKNMPSETSQSSGEESPAVRAVRLLKESDGTNTAITADVLMQITRMNDNLPESWKAIPPAQRSALIRRLITTGHLKLARESLHLAFSDRPQLKTADDLRAALLVAIDAHLATVVDSAGALTREGKPEAAIALLGDALSLRDEAALHFARGEARLALGHDLQALSDFYSVINAPNADLQARARKAAIGILERRWDIEGARLMLSGLDPADPFVQRSYARLDRRSKGEPALLVEATSAEVTSDTLMLRATQPSYNAYFALVVREVGMGGDEAFYRRLSSANYEFIQLLGAQRDLMSRAVFSLRTISQPHHSIPARGRITIALIARVSAQDEATCRDLALSLWGDLYAMLPLGQENVFIYEPVVDEGELQTLLTPFDEMHTAEIVRRDGVSDNVYTVNSFTPGTPDLHNVYWTLMRQTAPTMISVHLMPTRLYAWERPTQEDRPEPLNGGYGLPNGGLESVTPGGYSLDNMKRQLAQQQQWQKLNITSQRLAFLQNSFIIRVYVAGTAGTSQLLPEMAASTLFGPLQDGGVNGGYLINRPSKPEENAALRRNLATIDVESWGDHSEDPRLARFRYLISEGEASTVFRFPIPHSGGVPGMVTLEGKALVPPAGMPENGTRLGMSVARVRGVPVPITQGLDDRRRHSYVVGKTGMGKSTLLQTLILQDIEQGRGLFLLDPHGDLCEDVLARIPSHRADDVILLDPSDDEFPIGLNIMHSDDESDRDRIATDFIGMLIRMYDPHNYAIVGPIFQQTVRNAMLAVMSMPGGTLVDVYRLVSDQTGDYVKKVLPHIKDPIIRNYYETIYEQMKGASSQWKAEYLPYILSKFSRFVEDATLRRMIGQGRSGLPFDQIMDEGKILLVNLAKGRIGEQNAHFIGSLVLTGVMQAAFKRGAMPLNRRRDFMIYIDEVQNFATPTLATMLSEGRKFGVVLTIANQYLHQLNPQILEAVFGNIGSIIAFRLGIQDAGALGMEFYPAFMQQELSGLPQFTAAVKLLIDGVAARPFTMRTLPTMIPPDKARVAAIRDASRRLYGTPVQQVDQEIAARFA